MEKYAVDKENDPVEKLAMEKKGNLNRAREAAAKEIDNDKRGEDIREKS